MIFRPAWALAPVGDVERARRESDRLEERERRLEARKGVALARSEKKIEAAWQGKAKEIARLRVQVERLGNGNAALLDRLALIPGLREKVRVARAWALELGREVRVEHRRREASSRDLLLLVERMARAALYLKEGKPGRAARLLLPVEPKKKMADPAAPGAGEVPPADAPGQSTMFEEGSSDGTGQG